MNILCFAWIKCEKINTPMNMCTTNWLDGKPSEFFFFFEWLAKVGATG
jgi:hypothetical protein